MKIIQLNLSDLTSVPFQRTFVFNDNEVRKFKAINYQDKFLLNTFFKDFYGRFDFMLELDCG